jgi:hypothetical protein
MHLTDEATIKRFRKRDPVKQTHVIANDYTTYCGRDILTVPNANIVSWNTPEKATCKFCHVREFPKAVIRLANKRAKAAIALSNQMREARLAENTPLYEALRGAARFYGADTYCAIVGYADAETVTE